MRPFGLLDKQMPAEPEITAQISIKNNFNIPVEERSLKEIYPDVDTETLLQVEKLDNGNHSHLHQEYLLKPLPKLVVELTKPVPIPRFVRIQDDREVLEIEALKPFSKYKGYRVTTDLC